MRQRLVLLALLAVVAAATVLTIPRGIRAYATYTQWGTLSPQGAPPRIEYCGRGYLPGPQTYTREQLLAHGYGLSARVLTSPAGDPIYADVMSAATRSAYHTSVCTMGLALQLGPDRYLGYSLSGGP